MRNSGPFRTQAYYCTFWFNKNIIPPVDMACFWCTLYICTQYAYRSTNFSCKQFHVERLSLTSRIQNTKSRCKVLCLEPNTSFYTLQTSKSALVKLHKKVDKKEISTFKTGFRLMWMCWFASGCHQWTTLSTNPLVTHISWALQSMELLSN